MKYFSTSRCLDGRKNILKNYLIKINNHLLFFKNVAPLVLVGGA